MKKMRTLNLDKHKEKRAAAIFQKPHFDHLWKELPEVLVFTLWIWFSPHVNKFSFLFYFVEICYRLTTMFKVLIYVRYKYQSKTKKVFE